MWETWVQFLRWEDPGIWRRRDRLPTPLFLGFPCGSVCKESTCNVGDLGSIPGLERSPGGGHDNPFQNSCLEMQTDRGAWRATVHAVTKSRTQLSNYSHTAHPCDREKYWRHSTLRCCQKTAQIRVKIEQNKNNKKQKTPSNTPLNIFWEASSLCAKATQILTSHWSILHLYPCRSTLRPDSLNSEAIQGLREINITATNV